jgi:Zn-finger nucleic acid-binding protein
MPHEAVARHLAPSPAEMEQPVAASDALSGFCPGCRGLLVRARVDGPQPFHLDRCPVCGGIWFDAGEWARVASTEWLNHLDDLWDPVWRRRVREQRAHERHVEEVERALGADTLRQLRAAIDALREHPMRALGLSFLIEELRGPH